MGPGGFFLTDIPVSDKIPRVKGMYDITPEHTPLWRWVEEKACGILNAAGYGEIRLPLLEKTALFARSIGEETDVVSKEMYTFEDRNGDSLTLRPEATAGCVRAVIQNGLLHGHGVKVWYSGPMFRHENVQRGRNRQFYQIGAEAYGLAGPDVDAELIVLLQQLWEQLGIEGVELQINSLGSPESRAAYRDTLVEYLSDNRDRLDDDSVRRLERNPLRILDSKNPDMAAVVAQAPSLLDHLDPESADHFESLQEMLSACGVQATVNPRLVRGLDYYTRTVFEWVTGDLGSQGTICAGGRYDGLVQRLGGAAVPAVGYSMGLDRVVELIGVQGKQPDLPATQAYLIVGGQGCQVAGQVLADQLRRTVPGMRLQTNLGQGSFKSQFKRADRSGAELALVLAEDEVQRGVVQVKFLRDQREQLEIAQVELPGWLRQWQAEQQPRPESQP